MRQENLTLLFIYTTQNILERPELTEEENKDTKSKTKNVNESLEIMYIKPNVLGIPKVEDFHGEEAVYSMFPYLVIESS